MNNLTSKQRKVAYLMCVVVLLIPIIWLGMPATGEPGSGGKLAQLREEHELGEQTLGDLDPTSAAMSLVLLGMQGIATNLLWMEANDQQQVKDWSGLRATVNSIVLLQPHFIQVWKFQGWNLAKNVSAAWDAVADRYFWVKEGIKFYAEGSRRNELNPELYWDRGELLSNKIGRSDEWRQFRKFFMSDPDPRFEGQPDPEINPSRKDNYLVAKEVFQEANDREEVQEQHIMMRMIFRSYPARSQLNYGHVLQREGEFDEKTRLAFEQGFNEWTQKYGKESFIGPVGEIVLESDNEMIRTLAKKNDVSIEQQQHWTDRYQKTINYRYWRTRSLSESKKEMVDAHRDLYDGDQLLRAARLSEAQKKFESGMAHMAEILKQYPSLLDEDLTIEECLNAVLRWQYIHQLKGVKPPEQFPLRFLWDKERDRVPDLEIEFRREYGIR